MTLIEEKEYLQKVVDSIQEKIMQLELSLDHNEQEYRSVKKYTVDYKNELDKYEVYNHQQNLKFIDSRSILESNQVEKLQYQKQIPYFAKIVFRFDDDPDPENFYIGRYGFSDELGNQFVYDWRAPISALYYDFGVGKSAYEVNQQTFTGENLEKLQFDIEAGKLKRMFNVNDGVSDLFLTEALSKTGSQRMKTIVQTIQKEQNTIIRQPKQTDIIMQGVAGSGKTSIALHRLAYLLYQERETLAAENILILSPNRVFSSYIANVLPELGERDLRQLTFEELALPLSKVSIEKSYYEELTAAIEEPQSALGNTYRYKQSAEFEIQLLAFLQQLKTKIAKELQLRSFQVSSEKMQDFFATDLPLTKIFQQINQELTNDLPATEKKKGQAAILKELNKRLGFKNAEVLYRAFLQTLSEEYHSESFNYSDLYPLLYVEGFLNGLPVDSSVNYLVVDEMQDYSILQFKVLQQLFRARTIYCGDVYQTLIPKEADFLARLEKVASQPKIFYLKQSYRSSFEIIAFAQQFVPAGTIEPIQRHGDLVSSETITQKERKAKLSQQLEQFQASDLKSCGVLCQNETELRAIQAEIVNYEPQVITADSSVITQPILLTTPQYAKGLEFDKVILSLNKKTLEGSPALAYICATRALHELTVLLYKD